MGGRSHAESDQAYSGSSTEGAYDLLEWTLTDDAARVFQEHIDLKDWQEDLVAVARYFYENRSLVLNTSHQK